MAKLLSLAFLTLATASLIGTSASAASLRSGGDEALPPKLKTLSHFLHVDATKPKQSLDHAGVAVTESSAIILMQYMNKAERTAFLQNLFGPTETTTEEVPAGPNGATEVRAVTKPKAHLTAVRLTMGASDFNVNYYSYDDLPAGAAADYDLSYFSVAKDSEVMAPLLKEIKAINPNVKILATPWSAPGWMKDSGSITGGTFLGEPCTAAAEGAEGAEHSHHSSLNARRLRRRFGRGAPIVRTNKRQQHEKAGNGTAADSCKVFTAYSKYFVKFVEAYYTQFGLAIDYMTLQNEPLNSNPSMPSMILPSAVEGPLGVAVYKGLLDLAQRHKNSPGFVMPRLFGFDHNWDNVTYPEDVLATAGEAPTTPSADLAPFSGAAFHCYAGDVSNQTAFRNAYPNVDIWMTECTGGGWAPLWQDTLHWDAANLFIGNIENYGKSSFLWNMILTPEGGPKAPGGCPNCRGVYTYFKNNGTAAPTQDWWPLQNFATAVGLNQLSGNGGTVDAIETTIDSRPYPLILTATVNKGSSSSPASPTNPTYLSIMLNIDRSWCSSGAIHIPFLYTITLPKSGKVCKPIDPKNFGRSPQLKILCPSVSTTVFALTDPEERWVMVQLDQSYITRNETMTGIRYDRAQGDVMADWKTFSNWTCV